ncbi:BQ2448_4576 [Microbotryum intermedium]|uniref:BQ2448_4576 protein n=1 Tax=Microbotryum intermedium TaxID=269621 RepID=A0A238FDI1_9BASI|nr:BQ2448_4576 [Microbotryum intermedium]
MTATTLTTPQNTMAMTEIKLTAQPTAAATSSTAGSSSNIVSQQPAATLAPRTAEQEDTMRLQGGGECCRLLFCCPCIECLICVVTFGCVRPHFDCGC